MELKVDAINNNQIVSESNEMRYTSSNTQQEASAMILSTSLNPDNSKHLPSLSERQMFCDACGHKTQTENLVPATTANTVTTEGNCVNVVTGVKNETFAQKARDFVDKTLAFAFNLSSPTNSQSTEESKTADLVRNESFHDCVPYANEDIARNTDPVTSSKDLVNVTDVNAVMELSTMMDKLLETNPTIVDTTSQEIQLPSDFTASECLSLEAKENFDKNSKPNEMIFKDGNNNTEEFMTKENEVCDDVFLEIQSKTEEINSINDSRNNQNAKAADGQNKTSGNEKQSRCYKERRISSTGALINGKTYVDSCHPILMADKLVSCTVPFEVAFEDITEQNTKIANDDAANPFIEKHDLSFGDENEGDKFPQRQCVSIPEEEQIAQHTQKEFQILFENEASHDTKEAHSQYTSIEENFLDAELDEHFITPPQSLSTENIQQVGVSSDSLLSRILAVKLKRRRSSTDSGIVRTPSDISNNGRTLARASSEKLYRKHMFKDIFNKKSKTLRNLLKRGKHKAPSSIEERHSSPASLQVSRENSFSADSSVSEVIREVKEKLLFSKKIIKNDDGVQSSEVIPNIGPGKTTDVTAASDITNSSESLPIEPKYRSVTQRSKSVSCKCSKETRGNLFNLKKYNPVCTKKRSQSFCVSNLNGRQQNQFYELDDIDDVFETVTAPRLSYGQNDLPLQFKMSFDINLRDSRGNSCLHHASSKGDVTTITHLLDLGGNVWQKNNDNLLPMDLAPDFKTAKLLSHATLFYHEHNGSDAAVKNVWPTTKLITEL